MAKPPPYHMRVTAFVTITHWTETSPEVEVQFHTQHGSGLMRLYGRSHTGFPAHESLISMVAATVGHMLRDRLGSPWWAEMPKDAEYVPEPSHGDSST